MGPVLITGAGGLLGREVAKGLGEDGVALGRDRLDVTDTAAVSGALVAFKPRAVVHCAAMTDVDACELDSPRAFAVNADGCKNVCEAAERAGAHVVAVSTDYVFDGEKGSAYTELDEPRPIQAYGRSKLAGEQYAPCVVRSAWIYGPGGKNFLSRLFEIAAAGSVKAVTDQTGSPTYAPDLAAAIVELVGAGATGTFHVTNEGACTFAEFCRHAVELAGLGPRVEEVSWRDLGRLAARPANTSLDNAAFRRAGFEPLRGWREAAKAFVGSVAPRRQDVRNWGGARGGARRPPLESE